MQFKVYYDTEDGLTAFGIVDIPHLNSPEADVKMAIKACPEVLEHVSWYFDWGQDVEGDNILFDAGPRKIEPYDTVTHRFSKVHLTRITGTAANMITIALPLVLEADPKQFKLTQTRMKEVAHLLQEISIDSYMCRHCGASDKRGYQFIPCSCLSKFKKRIKL